MAAVVAVVRREPRFPAQAVVENEFAGEPIGVLRVVPEVVLAQVQQRAGTTVGLRQGRGSAQQQVGYRVARVGAAEGEEAIFIVEMLLVVLLVDIVEADLEKVLPAYH